MLQTLYETTDGEYFLSTDKRHIDVDVVHRFLAESSSWARGIPRETVEEAIRNSLCFGLYRDGALLAFCRVVTDGATFGNLVDVFVLPEMRGYGLSKMLARRLPSGIKENGRRKKNGTPRGAVFVSYLS